MSQVLITKSKLDTLAQTVATKASISLPLSIDEINTAVANLNTAVSIQLQNKTVTPTTQSQAVSADSNYDGLGVVTVNAIPSNYIVPSGTLTITSNGTTSVSAYANVTVNVTPSLQNKTVTPTTSSQSVTADSNYNGLGTVTVNPIPSNYIITTDANATANDILSGKTAYVNGVKITGTVNLGTYYSGTSTPASSLGSNGDFYFMTN